MKLSRTFFWQPKSPVWSRLFAFRWPQFGSVWDQCLKSLALCVRLWLVWPKGKSDWVYHSENQDKPLAHHIPLLWLVGWPLWVPQSSWGLTPKPSSASVPWTGLCFGLPRSWILWSRARGHWAGAEWTRSRAPLVTVLCLTPEVRNPCPRISWEQSCVNTLQMFGKSAWSAVSGIPFYDPSGWDCSSPVRDWALNWECLCRSFPGHWSVG